MENDYRFVMDSRTYKVMKMAQVYDTFLPPKMALFLTRLLLGKRNKRKADKT